MENQNMNAIETWALYDSILVGPGQGEKSGLRWYDSFESLSEEVEIGFFTSRNRSNAGPAYCNMDTAEQVSFPFTITSLGVSFLVPPFNDANPADVNPFGPGSGSPNYVMFAELAKHCSFRLIISQDEKINCVVLSAPGGDGLSGFVTGGPPNTSYFASNQFSAVGLGMPDKRGRMRLKREIEIPRNRNIAAFLQFSTFARHQLKNMIGPGRIVINPAFVDPATGVVTYESVTIPACVIMRVSLFGRRGVQQRNNLRF